MNFIYLKWTVFYSKKCEMSPCAFYLAINFGGSETVAYISMQVIGFAFVYPDQI